MALCFLLLTPENGNISSYNNLKSQVTLKQMNVQAGVTSLHSTDEEKNRYKATYENIDGLLFMQVTICMSWCLHSWTK